MPIARKSWWCSKCDSTIRIGQKYKWHLLLNRLHPKGVYIKIHTNCKRGI